MKKLFAIGFLMSAALAGCGGKSTSAVAPNNAGGTGDMKSGGTGGATYGDAKGPPAPAPAGDGANSDPCAGGQ